MSDGERSGRPDAAGVGGAPSSPETPRRRHMFDVPLWLDRAAAWSWRLLLLAAAIFVAGLVFARLRVIIVPTLVALLIAALLAPSVARLRTWGIPRLLATWMVLLTTLAVVGGAIVVAVFLIADRVAEQSDRWDDIGRDVRAWLVEDAPVDITTDQVDQWWERIRTASIAGLQGTGSDVVRVVIELTSGVLLGVVLLFFFVRDGDRMWTWVTDRFDTRRGAAIRSAGQDAIVTLGGYVRGLAVTGLVDAVVIGIGLWILDVPLALPLAVITFFAAFIPVVGAISAGALAVVVALVLVDPQTAVAVALLVLIVQQVEGDVVMPLVMKRQVALHPAVVLLSVTAGGVLAGVIGAFLAVPLVAGAVVLVRSLRLASEREELIVRPPPDSGPESAPDAGH